MTITYNNLSSPADIITFTDIPNILKVNDTSGGTHARFYLLISSTLKNATIKNNQWYITFMGDTITNVLDPNEAVNKNFYVSNNVLSTTVSVVRALRNCPTIAANFNVESTTYQNSMCVALTAKSVGTVWSNMTNYYDTNIASTYMGAYGYDGSYYASSALTGALIDVDVYSDGDYITTLEKSWYNGEVAFNMSPVLTTISQNGKTKPYDFKISSIKDGEYTLLGTISENYITPGYMCNQGYKYLPLDATNPQLAQNVSRGKDAGYTNKTLLYVYEPSIRLSVYGYSNQRPPIEVKYLDSAFNMIYNTSTQNWTRTNSDILLNDLLIDLNTTYFNQAFYIRVVIGGDINLLYRVIKPIKATEYYQRILWRNSYGGISFFDFTGSKSETRDIEISTYQKNIFGYYTDQMNELERVYDNEVKYTVTLKSHLFEHDGKYQFNDLIQSSQVWTEINGETYGIILDSVSVDETDQNDIYEATVKYHYSQEPSLI